MQNKIPYVGIGTIISEWIRDNDLQEDEYNTEDLKRWASDCNEWLTFADAQKHKIMVLSTSMGKVEMPNDMLSIVQIAYRKREERGDECTTGQKVSQWVQHDYNTGLDVEINVKCNKCKNKTCTCNQGVVEIDIDPIWRLENPFHDYFGRMGRPGKFGENRSHYTESFKIMSYAGGDFHSVDFHIPNCYNLSARECEHKYSINYPVIQTDIREDGTEILLSYIARETDKNGDYMIPSVSNAIQSVKSHLSHLYFQKRYHRTLEQKYANAADRFFQQREYFIGLTRSELNQLGFHELYELFSSVSGIHNSQGNKYNNFGMTDTRAEDTYLKH